MHSSGANVRIRFESTNHTLAKFLAHFTADGVLPASCCAHSWLRSSRVYVVLEVRTVLLSTSKLRICLWRYLNNIFFGKAAGGATFSFFVFLSSNLIDLI